VAAAANRDEHFLRPREIHRRDDVGDVGAARDQPGAPLNHGVVDRARGVVLRVPGLDQFSA